MFAAAAASRLACMRFGMRKSLAMFERSFSLLAAREALSLFLILRPQTHSLLRSFVRMRERHMHNYERLSGHVLVHTAELCERREAKAHRPCGELPKTHFRSSAIIAVLPLSKKWPRDDDSPAACSLAGSGGQGPSQLIRFFAEAIKLAGPVAI